MTKDVNAAWKTLYDRQAPLLTWPETVQERFQQVGPQMARERGRRQGPRWRMSTTSTPIQAYVDMVYKTFKPFDYETGEGIVAAPPKEVLLRPAQFTIESMPGLGKVWAAQERLWIQRTLLEVVAQVNKNAKDWDSATISEINGLEVGNPLAQDQRSIAKGQTARRRPRISSHPAKPHRRGRRRRSRAGGMAVPARDGRR